jgi:hypothetical protein
MPSTDRKLELKAKASVAQSASQVAVCAKGLTKHGTKYIQVLHYGIWPWRGILNGACISISNLPENIVWQTDKDDLRPEARGLGRSPHLPPPNAGYENWRVPTAVTFKRSLFVPFNALTYDSPNNTVLSFYYFQSTQQTQQMITFYYG